MRLIRPTLPWLVSLVWGVAVVSGFGVLLDYAATPGSECVAASDWPADSSLFRDDIRLTLILALHPHCPCSHATVSELAEIMAQRPSEATVHVLFLKPAKFPHGWEHTALWDEADAIPNIQVHCDVGGREAKRFGVSTSGQALLFSANGRILFRGGITPTRGHAGENAGREAIVSVLTGGTAARTTTPVFGCPLFDPDPTTTSTR